MTHVPTKVTETTQLPDQTKTAEVTDYTTLTSLCPYTETVTKGGSTYTTVKTSTEVRSNCRTLARNAIANSQQTIVTKVPTTIQETAYTTSLTTACKHFS